MVSISLKEKIQLHNTKPIRRTNVWRFPTFFNVPYTFFLVRVFYNACFFEAIVENQWMWKSKEQRWPTKKKPRENVSVVGNCSQMKTNCLFSKESKATNEKKNVWLKGSPLRSFSKDGHGEQSHCLLQKKSFSSSRKKIMCEDEDAAIHFGYWKSSSAIVSFRLPFRRTSGVRTHCIWQ